MALVVENLAQLTKTFNQAPSDVKKAYKAELRTVAEPVRSSAERLASERIRRMTPKWSRMRTGVTQKLVYVVPRSKGARGNRRRGRPKFADLLGERAMDPALAENEHRIEQDFDDMLDRLSARWNRG